MELKEENEKAGLKLNIQKTKLEPFDLNNLNLCAHEVSCIILEWIKVRLAQRDPLIQIIKRVSS